MAPRMLSRVVATAANRSSRDGLDGVHGSSPRRRRLERCCRFIGVRKIFPELPSLDAAIREALQSRADAPVNYYAEYLESETFPSEPSTLALRDYIRRKFEGRRIDVVVANATPALQFVLRFREELFPRVPIVFLAGRIPEAIAQHKVAGITGVLSDVRAGRDTGPGAEAAPVGETCVRRRASADCRGVRRRVRAALSRFSERVELTYITRAVAAWPPCRCQGHIPARLDSLHPLHASRQRGCRLF